jgi:hypothetical protein
VNVDSVTDSAWVQVVHNWVAPDSFLVPRQWIKLSNSRYWTVQGIFPAGFTARGTFQYNGTNSLTSGQLDNTWMTNAEDSLLLFYRPSAACDWTMLNNITRNIGSPNDRVGNIVVSQLLPGDYTLGTYDAPIGIAPEAEPLNIKVFPNPNDGRFWLELPSAYGFFEITLTDASGRVVFSREVRDEAKVPLAYTGHGAGWYLVVVRDELGRSGFQRVLIDK